MHGGSRRRNRAVVVVVVVVKVFACTVFATGRKTQIRYPCSDATNQRGPPTTKNCSTPNPITQPLDSLRLVMNGDVTLVG